MLTMLHLMPQSWRQGLSHMRNKIHDAMNRWWHRHHHTAANGTAIAVGRVPPERLEDNTEAHPFSSWLSPQQPLIDIEETDDDIRITAELPGLEKDDFTVHISDKRLFIRGEKRQSSEKKSRGAYDAECSYGAFARAIPLPSEVDAAHAQAIYIHGTLRMTLPKTDRAKSRCITVQVHG
jgi:HSP20 family protein